MNLESETKPANLNRNIGEFLYTNWESILFAVLVVLAVVSRFYNLGTRVMSHDESLHTYYSWNLYQGKGFQHTPMMHGPLQFHLIALAYFLFGDSDFTARIPAALASIASIVILWKYRKYLGKAGAFAAAGLMLISPFMLYYGRYVRNEALVVLFGLIFLWGTLEYLKTGAQKYLIWVTISVVLHFVTKETAFIYTAQMFLFLAGCFVYNISKKPWAIKKYQKSFKIAVVLTILMFFIASGFWLYGGRLSTLNSGETAPPAIPEEQNLAATVSPIPLKILLPLALFLICGILSLWYLLRGFKLAAIREERSFDLMILLSTFVLPQLAPFPAHFLGWDPVDYSQTGMIRMAFILVPFLVTSALIGLWWNRKQWLIHAAVFYAVYMVFYTTLFTNGSGFFTGLVGSLGYWLAQQAVERGSQPVYYYALIQIPVYEFLPAFGSLTAIFLWLKHSLSPGKTRLSTYLEEHPDQKFALGILIFWSVSSFFAYTIAGEKMPWLTVHIALPMILLSGWLIGYFVDTTNWAEFTQLKAYASIGLLFIFITSLYSTIASVFGSQPPFQGKELDQLRATGSFFSAIVSAGLSGFAFVYITREIRFQQVPRAVFFVFIGLLGVLTLRTAIRASYIEYDNATEYLVYAHSATGVKDVMRQIDEIGNRTGERLNLQVAYDNDVSWPFSWYLRNYKNQRYYGENPTRDLRELPVILVGDDNFGKIEPVVGQAYIRFDYIRMWWPDQDYFGLTLERIKNTLTDSKMRSALFKIWLNRDYTDYAQLNGKDMSLANWQPSDRMRLYIRKDIGQKLWNYGLAASSSEEIIQADPYEGGKANLAADFAIGIQGQEPGQFNQPRGIAVAQDGSIYVTDLGNQRIQHLSKTGEVLQVWGSYGVAQGTQSLPGQFYDPWGIAVGLDGSVYVADTWNHRIQKFTADGQYLTSWGYFGQAEDAYAIWGPRDVLVDSQGRVFVTDTGNKRVVIYDENGGVISQFGGPGLLPGLLDEPVGIAITSAGEIVIADTWNQRIQTYRETSPNTFSSSQLWDIAGWYGQSLENKPFLAVDNRDHIFTTDPEGYRIIEFDQAGKFIQYWGDFGNTLEQFNLPIDIAFDLDHGLWVTDSANNRILHFTLPNGGNK